MALILGIGVSITYANANAKFIESAVVVLLVQVLLELFVHLLQAL